MWNSSEEEKLFSDIARYQKTEKNLRQRISELERENDVLKEENHRLEVECSQAKSDLERLRNEINWKM